MVVARAMSKKFNPAHLLLEKHLKELELDFRREWRFHPLRRWRFDYALGGFVDSQNWEPNHIAIEIEGGTWISGRHSRGKGYEADCIKYSTASMMGFRVLRFTTQQVLRGIAKAFLKEWICGRSIGQDRVQQGLKSGA